MAEHYHWSHEDIMSMTEAEIAYYLATLIIHDIEPQKAVSKRGERKARKFRRR